MSFIQFIKDYFKRVRHFYGLEEKNKVILRQKKDCNEIEMNVDNINNMRLIK